MAIVKGQIESLKSIKSELHRNGIHRFNSVGELNAFIRDYEKERRELLLQTEQSLNTEIETLKEDATRLKDALEVLRTSETQKLNSQITALKEKYELTKSRSNNFLTRVINFFKLKSLKRNISHLENNFDSIIADSTLAAQTQLEKTNKKLEEYTTNKDRVISARSIPKLNKLELIKNVVDDLYPLIAGAIGESLVVKELSKLSDQHILFNDFSLKFHRPIYNKKEKDRIFSIQIDHLLVNNAGIFILETKNWSKQSLENYDLRSPIRQIKRTSYALFTILNGNSTRQGFSLNQHHWGAKQIPIRNVVVMINHKPKEKFKFVAVKTLSELNGYINFFDPVLDDSEVKSVSDFLDSMRDHNEIDDATNNTRSYSNASNYEHSPGKPGVQEWLRNNPGKGVHDYYSKFGI